MKLEGSIRNRTNLTRLLCSGAILAAAASSPALAQSANDGSGAAAIAEPGIVVTAQKRSELLQDVPISITALTPEALETSGVESLTDIETITPGLTFQPAGTFIQPMIRGVGTSNIAPGFGSNVGIYLDGFILPNPGASDIQLLNVESVQVLKGPQGTLFGRNTTGGAILVTTTDPSDITSVRAEASYASRDSQSYEGYLTTGITSGVAVDVGVRYAKGDGFLTNIVTGSPAGKYENFNVRTGLKIDLSDTFSILARYSHSISRDASLAHHSVLCCNADGVPYSSTAYAPGAIIATGPDEVSSSADIPGRTRADAYQLTAELDLGFAQFTSYTQYRDESVYQGVDLGSSSIPSFLLQFDYMDKIFTQEFLLNSSPGTRLQWTVGAFYFNDVSTAFTEGSLGGGPFLTLITSHNRNQTLAGYADLTYELTDRLFLTGGLRLANDKFDRGFNVNGPLNNLLGDPRTLVPFSDIDDTTLTPRAVIRFEPDSNSSIYASFTKGYKSGFRNIAANSDLEIMPEKITAYEIGYKRAGAVLSGSVAAFYYNYEDLQVGSYQGPVAIVANAAKSRIYGIEGDLRIALSPAFEITAAATYLDAKYRSFENAPFAIQCTIAEEATTCPGGSALTTPPGAFFPPIGSFASGQAAARDIEDSPMQFAPEFSGNIGARYRADLGGGELVLSGNFSYTAKYYLDAVAQFATSAHENLSLRAQWTDPNDRLTLAVFGQNVTDSRYRTVIQPNTVAVVTNWNAPRTIGASIGIKY